MGFNYNKGQIFMMGDKRDKSFLSMPVSATLL